MHARIPTWAYIQACTHGHVYVFICLGETFMMLQAELSSPQPLWGHMHVHVCTHVHTHTRGCLYMLAKPMHMNAHPCMCVFM